MSIWSAEIKELEKLYESLKGQLLDLEKELERLIRADDENMILLYSRRCLEVIITDLCECELKRPRKTEPLKGIIDKLHKEEKIPSHIVTSMHGLNELSTYGVHPKDFDPEQIKPVLNNLAIIIRWYLKYKQIVTIDKTEVDEEKIRLSKEPPEEVIIKERTEIQDKPAKAGERKLISMVTIVAILIIAAIITYPKIFKRDTIEKLRASGERISVAVIPFQNLTNDNAWNVWQDGIQEILTTSLSYSEEIKVSQTENVKSIIQSKGLTNYASMTPSFAKTISQKLDANVFIFGNIIQAGTKLRVNAQLIDTKTKEILKPYQIEGYSEEKDIFRIIDTLSVQLKNFLLISKLKKGVRTDFQQFASTSSPEAYRYFIYGNNAFFNVDYPAACNWFLKAINVDSNFVGAIVKLSYAYMNQGLIEEAKKWCLNACTKKNFTSDQQKIFIDLLYAGFFETPNEQLRSETQLLTIDDQLPIIYYRKGLTYNGLYQYDKAIPAFEKALDIYNKWDVKPAWIYNYSELGLAYHKTGQYKKEKILYKKAEKDFPDRPNLIYRQAILALSEGETKDANEYIEKYKSLCIDQSASEAAIATNVANIYWQAELLDKAEEYFREALSLETESPARMNNLGWFWIDTDRNIKEGLEINDKALELSPDDYYYLDCKGWGLYKQGRYADALELLGRAWSLKPVYYHELYLHLEAAKKAVAGQKN